MAASHPGLVAIAELFLIFGQREGASALAWRAIRLAPLLRISIRAGSM